MLIASYIVLAVLVIGLSMRLSSYVDMLDKQTNLSGAFLGGVMLAAVTSLPELFTSISGVVFLNEPELVVGNILGSNLFNLAALSLVSLFGIKVIQRAAVSSSQGKTVLFSLAIYALLAVVAGDFFHIYFAGINIASFVIILLYIWGIKSLSLDDSSTEEAELAGDLSARVILLRFALLSLLLVLVSVSLTFVTDLLSQKYNLGVSFAGAVFLGVATSLPELVSTIQLVRLGNYNAACGNILGSNLINFTILAIADFLYTAGTVYIFDYQSMVMLFCGAVACLTMLLFVRSKTTRRQLRRPRRTFAYNMLLMLLGAACYWLFLLLTV